MPARRKYGPSRWSRPTPSATLTTSAPVASQTFAISLMNEMRVIRNALAASLIISAELTSQRTIGVRSGSYSAATIAPSASSNAPTTTRSGCMNSSTARPSDRNSGFETYPTLPSPRAWRPSRTFAPVPTGTVDFITRTGRPSSAGSSSTTLQTRDRSASPAYVGIEREREPSAIPLQELRHVLLVERHLATLEPLDLLAHDVADHHLVSELGEADAFDQPDPAGTEDADACHRPGA